MNVIPIVMKGFQLTGHGGRIVAVGEQVDTGLIDARVLVEPCIFEAGGKELDQPWYFGSECDGGFAEYTIVAARHAPELTKSP